MYAAAGGASLASRQARQKQRQNKKTERLQQLKNQKGSELLPKQLQAKQFHNYTDPAVPRLSRVERGVLKPPPPHERRHSTSNYHLKEPGHRTRIRESPSISIPVVQNHQPPQPLTPCTLVQENHLHSNQSTTSLHNQLPQILIPEGEGKLERRCSFVRQVEEMEKCPEGGVLDRCHHICNFEIKDKQWVNEASFFPELEKDIFGSLDYPFSECSQGRAAWQERERGRRCSLSEEARQHRIKQTEAHHRWMKRNRIHDTTYGGGSEEDDFFSVYHQSAAANALLYVGLGTVAIGAIIYFVGSGEKGFKTLELRLIGPTLVACGLLCCLIRVLLCACPSTCFRKRKKSRLKSSNCPHSSSRYPLAPKYRDAHDNSDFVAVDKTGLLSKQKKKVSIVPPNHSLPSTSTTEFKELPVFHQDEKPPSVHNSIIPQINLPELTPEGSRRMSREDSIIELENLELAYDIQSVSSNDSGDSITVVETIKQSTSKLARSREPVNVTSDNIETCLSVVIERSDNSESSDEKNAEKKSQEHSEKQTTHSGIVLSPLQLGQ